MFILMLKKQKLFPIAGTSFSIPPVVPWCSQPWANCQKTLILKTNVVLQNDFPKASPKRLKNFTSHYQTWLKQE